MLPSFECVLMASGIVGMTLLLCIFVCGGIAATIYWIEDRGWSPIPFAVIMLASLLSLLVYLVALEMCYG
jgi:cation transporter-like permease